MCTCAHKCTHKPALSSDATQHIPVTSPPRTYTLAHIHTSLRSAHTCNMHTHTQACAQLIPATSPPRTCTLAHIYKPALSSYLQHAHTHIHEPALSTYLQQASLAHTHLHTYTQAWAQLILATCSRTHTSLRSAHTCNMHIHTSLRSAHTCNKPPTHIHTCTHTHKPVLSSYLQHAHTHTHTRKPGLSSYLQHAHEDEFVFDVFVCTPVLLPHLRSV